MRQRHAEDGVAGFEHRHIHRLVRLRTGMRLHVGIFRAEQRLGAVDRQLFRHVHIFAAAVVALAGIAFRILVGQLAALRFHHCRAGVVFRRDQLDVIFLAAVFILDGRPQIGVGMGDGVFAGEHGAIPELSKLERRKFYHVAHLNTSRQRGGSLPGGSGTGFHRRGYCAVPAIVSGAGFGHMIRAHGYGRTCAATGTDSNCAARCVGLQ